MSDQPKKPDLPPHPALAALRTHRNFYGRVHGKTLRPAQRSYLSEDLTDLRLRGVSIDENPERSPLDMAQALPGDGPIWLEIGFGGGEHMVHMAAAYPKVRLIGCEPFVNGVAMALGLLRNRPCPNLLLHPGDARDLFDVMPDATLDKVFLNYPDPWPKARHHRRRFVTQDHLVPLFAACKPGAEFRVATDIADYARQTLEEVPLAGFELVSDSRTAWADWFSTRYEQKALREGRTPHYMTFRKP
ncbi:tRNA (guanine(46)-N(7))-methyltransferase TrmB [Pararhodobacter zhoushanensis]|uniref:tRNA (guanine(46)-N(7))-methyltransferase TrmB n=1 Tax=Pararhodobacter zhoushanensis TaxID=2479545 RepID=UPI000F8F55D4|nr:tRNA (guanine(46)-N(7))-methyltransferase TrmB [Pararhodobacter zhoushanensis]